MESNIITNKKHYTMKKKTILFALGLLLLGSLKAQTSMPVPHGSFEQWTSHPAYSLSFFGMSFPIHDSCPYPTGWNYLSYPVNETVPVLNLNINTNLPLMKISRETGSVPDSNSAAKLQTFMLEDLIFDNIYSLVESQLDSMLTQTVFPSVLSTGAVDLETFIPIVSNLLSNMDSVEDILASLATMDVNELISGGIALNGFEPSRLTGSYKYHSAVSGDNGAVILLGTHYNPVTQQRDVVGGGANTSLTDIANYTPFTVDYLSLHSLDSSFPEQAPDSLIVILLSSASENMQQGSYLCVDNLLLWHDTIPVVPPDTCAAIAGLTAAPAAHETTLNWSTTAVVNGYELEYGLAGFSLGSGTRLTLTNNTATLTGLAANTLYSVFLRTLCSDSIYGEWTSLQFLTTPDTCASITGLTATPDIHEAVIEWSTTGTVSGYELEYGLAGFSQGSGTSVFLSANTVTLIGLIANTSYDLYLRTRCSDSIYGNWVPLQFRTLPDTCATVLDLVIVATPDIPTYYSLQWSSSSEPQSWEVEYGLHGFALGTGTVLQVNNHNHYLFISALDLDNNTDYDFYLRSVCDGSIYGEWDSVLFHSPCGRVDHGFVHDNNLSFTPDSLVNGYRVSWGDRDGISEWEVRFGNDTLGYQTTIVSQPNIDLPPLMPNTRYTVLVASRCGEDAYGEWYPVVFTTIELPVGIDQAETIALTVTPNPAHGSCTVTLPGGEPTELKLFSLDGRLLQTVFAEGTSATLLFPSSGVFLLQATTPSGIATRKIVNK